MNTADRDFVLRILNRQEAELEARKARTVVVVRAISALIAVAAAAAATALSPWPSLMGGLTGWSVSAAAASGVALARFVLHVLSQHVQHLDVQTTAVRLRADEVAGTVEVRPFVY